MIEVDKASLYKTIGGVVRDIEKKKIAIYALCLYYSGVALQEFRTMQAGNEFWDNQTRTALSTVFSGAIYTADILGFFLAHAVIYGVFLELANFRQNESLMPVLRKLEKRFMDDLREIVE